MKKGKVSWQSPSNIAIVKYWGKKNVQQGINPSLSFSLSNSFTETEIIYQPKRSGEKIAAEFFFEGKQKQDFESRILKYFESIYNELDLFKEYELEIHSKNTFPHSAGIASSASAMSSLVLSLLSIERTIREIPSSIFYKRASGLSRLASGSASRSVYGGFNLWGKLEDIYESSDDYAIPFPHSLHPVFKNLQDSILIVSSGEKAISSSTGHKLMEDHPYKAARIRQANNHCKNLIPALRDGDFSSFIKICEIEAISLHELMRTSTPSYILMKAETLLIIDKIRQYRKENGENLCFTLDAGPNIHLIYPEEDKEKIHEFIKTELLVYCENKQWIEDRIGNGPKQLN